MTQNKLALYIEGVFYLINLGGIMKRKELREIAVKLFYEMDIQKNFNNEFFNEFIVKNNLNDIEDNYVNIYTELKEKRKW